MLPPGLWHLRIREAGKKGCDLVIHRDDRLPGMRAQGLQSRLVEKEYSRRTEDGRWPAADPPGKTSGIRRNGTVSAYARGDTQIRVGATFAQPPGQIVPYSGLLDDGSVGDATAPTDASPSQSGMNLPKITPGGRQRLSGTSFSAPQVTRWLAAALADGKVIPNRKAFGEAIRGADGSQGTSILPVTNGDKEAPALKVPVLPWRPGFEDRRDRADRLLTATSMASRAPRVPRVPLSSP